RRPDQTLLGNPRQTGHLAVTVERMNTREHRVGPDIGPRPDRRHPGAHDHRLIPNQRAVTHAHTRHIGDRVVRPSRQRSGADAKITKSHAALTPNQSTHKMPAPSPAPNPRLPATATPR